MKKALFLFALLFSISLTACEDDSEDPQEIGILEELGPVDQDWRGVTTRLKQNDDLYGKVLSALDK